MYSQSVRARAKTRKSAAGRTGNRSDKKARKERVRLRQLAVCLVLFLTVFIGKGVFPQRLQQVSGQLLTLMGRSVDFRSAFIRLGQSLAEEDAVLGEIGSFCMQVFGPVEEDFVPVFASIENEMSAERQFLNSAPDQAVLMAHYLRMDEVPGEWFFENEAQTVEEEPVQQTELPAVGAVLLKADYEGPELPEGYTMDQLSLGGLEVATPVMGNLWSVYGYRDHPIDGEYKFHNGVDIGAELGVEIGAFAAGTVEYIGESDIYGKYLQIDHGQGIKSFYAHCSQLLVEQGQHVKVGERVAQVGSTGNATGPHLHFELKCGGVHVDPAYYIAYKTP